MKVSMPAQCWSLSTLTEDTVLLHLYNGEWTGRTEADQCVKRDLNPSEVADALACARRLGFVSCT